MWRSGCKRKQRDSPLGLDKGGRGQEAAEEAADVSDTDQRQLDAEADDDAEHEGHDAVLEDSQAAHRARGAVEDEDDEDVGNADGAAGDERDLEQEVQRNGRADDLFVFPQLVS